MPKPVILLVDDEPHVLNAVDRDLRRQYSRTYQIAKAPSGAEALNLVQQLKQRGAAVALFLVDQRMPGMTGTEFLMEAKQFYPDSCKVLLTAYADTQAAINSINQIGLDYYLIKPWDPPEEHLYPILDDLLADWESNAEPVYEGIRVAGTLWSPKSHMVKDFLARNQIPYKWLDVEMDSDVKTLVEKVTEGTPRLPVIFFPDGEVLIDPAVPLLAEKVGLQTAASQPFYDLVIIGGGPAGLAAGVYAGSEGLRTVIVEREATGGQAGTSSRIENYLGFPRGLSGVDLARRAVSQAKRFGVEILTAQEAVGLRVEDPYRYVSLANGMELACHAVLIATGVSVRRLTVPGME
ncbi:MAG TPA: response regulator, partial [Anaerolineaceae bacterium]|nr:response regulator [Anaerolineaceae bacterium]